MIMEYSAKSKWKKTSKKNRLLLCFRPPLVNDDSEHEPISHTKFTAGEDPVFAYFSVGKNKEGVMFPTISPSSDVKHVLNEAEEEEECGSRRKNKSSHRRFSQVVKEVFFGSSVANKIKKLKKQKSLESNNNVLSETSDNSKLKKSLKSWFKKGTNSNASSSVFTSSSISSSSISSGSTLASRSSYERQSSVQSNPIEFKQNQNDSNNYPNFIGLLKPSQGGKERECYVSNIGFCLILISLWVLIEWGKICAILFTLTWLLMVPHWSIRYKDPPTGKMEDKKKIILEGSWLHRNGRGCVI
ncbi:hypothetical protein O6P43_000907 [Quillaja saponaria]|uniref:Uncharacterized protein n=1 Tax=Quillaja saponaria TaxID=32244 RepID=A0AAD7QHS9_QUISA|nr:hypothetical protein O6P43_000907 [Quillaja saponaria]